MLQRFWTDFEEFFQVKVCLEWFHKSLSWGPDLALGGRRNDFDQRHGFFFSQSQLTVEVKTDFKYLLLGDEVNHPKVVFLKSLFVCSLSVPFEGANLSCLIESSKKSRVMTSF